MTTIQIYDKPMCCSTGICGPDVDPVLPRFAADLSWLRSQGHDVERFNLSQDPLRFAENAAIKQLLSECGTSCLPVILVDGHVVSTGAYPSRESLLKRAAGNTPHALPVTGRSESCCGNTGCC